MAIVSIVPSLGMAKFILTFSTYRASTSAPTIAPKTSYADDILAAVTFKLNIQSYNLQLQLNIYETNNLRLQNRSASV